jgi:hypothetical protein
VIAIGQAYVHGLLMSSAAKKVPPLDALAQILIFSPVFVVMALRRQSLETVWLPVNRVWLRVLFGVGLALAALAVSLVIVGKAETWPEVVASIYQPNKLSYFVQVFLEDIAIAFLFVRIAAAIGVRPAILLTSALFAAGHIPTLLAQGASLSELTTLLLDAGLGALMIGVVARSRDVWWFWQVHFVMDMTQFVGTK